MSTGQNRSEEPNVADERRLWLALVEQAAKTDLLQSQLNQLRASLSWRVTGPLRSLRSLLGRDETRAGCSSHENAGNAGPAAIEPPSWVTGLEACEGDSRSRWLVDVTELAREDLGAGVERVTRRFLAELLLAPPPGARVQPVRLLEQGSYVCANGFLAGFLGMPSTLYGDDVPVNPRLGDCFVGLDFCRVHAKGLELALAGMRKAGVPVHLVVHDVLPMTHPQWFPAEVPGQFLAWLRVLTKFADVALCDSHHTEQELRAVLEREGLDGSRLQTAVIPLGADFPPAPAVSSKAWVNPASFRVLTVGTIEPRKGHSQALAAFDALWQQGADFQWIIAGKGGWSVGDLVDRIRRHPEFGRRLLWLEGPDDRVLASLYQQCNLLLAPSYGEGYGLPVAEAGRMGLPLLLRDLPVFREIAGDDASYFAGDHPQALAESLLQWHSRAGRRADPPPRWKTWAQSAGELKKICGPAQSTNILE